jgi:hypothetical protein
MEKSLRYMSFSIPPPRDHPLTSRVFDEALKQKNLASASRQG